MDELRWRERDLDLRRGADFLGEVHEVCRLYVAQDPTTRDADITELTVPVPDGLRLDYLVVSYRRGPWEERFVVGAHEGRVTAEVLDRFRRTVCQQPQRRLVGRRVVPIRPGRAGRRRRVPAAPDEARR